MAWILTCGQGVSVAGEDAGAVGRLRGFVRRYKVCFGEMSLSWKGALRYGSEMGQFLGLDIVYSSGNEGLDE